MDFIRSIKTLAGFKGRKGTKEGLNVLHLEDENRVVAIDRKGEEVPFGSGGGSGEVVYLRGLISQQNTDNPTFVVLENSLGDFELERGGVGSYTFELKDHPQAYDEVFANVGGGRSARDFNIAFTEEPGFVTINTFDREEIDVLYDGLLSGTPVEIAVYPAL